MKSTGTIQAGTGLWNSPNNGATNESGFSAVPAGQRYSNGSLVFLDLGNSGYWWSSSGTIFILPGAGTCTITTAMYTESAVRYFTGFLCVACGISETDCQFD